MASYWPLIWLGIGIIAAIIEGLTVQLVSIWFALSAAITALITLIWHPDISIQLLIFSIVGLALLLITRPFVKRKLTVTKQCTNADRVIGEIAVVTHAIADGSTGRVLVTGMDWSAKAIGDPLTPGTRVIVKAIEGVTLLVEAIPSK